MFTWSTAKSAAESVLSGWVLKRGFKFLLKKNLGKLFLGDIDPDQLEVQLTQGTIQLHDLALNVDYLNSQIGGAASIFIKEGSIGTLLVKMPWKGSGCQVEVDELEIVLTPCIENRSADDGESCSTSPDDNNTSVNNSSRKHEHGMADSAEKPAPNSVHEGVKTIAKMVKLFLTSFNVKVRNLLVAFDPFLEKDETRLGCQASLVFRISEIEYGTCVSEDVNSKTDPRAEDFLGISQLTNFAKFHGAVLELLQMDNSDSEAHDVAETSLGKQFLGYCPSNATTPILTGRKGGFSGNLKLSIPWKNGSLDIRKVDADVSIDPLELRFQPRTMKWLLLTWETCKSLSEDRSSHMQDKSVESVCHSSALISDNVISTSGRFSTELASLNAQELIADEMLPGTHFIRDWMPFSVDRNQNGAEDIDIAASVDQFFECFDGMRSSQSALGSSGMWNWTCSVFSAITAASTLASGSLQIPSEHHHVQTNLKATFAGLSTVCFFHDEDKSQLSDLNDNLNNISLGLHYLGVECRDIELVLQVCPQDLRVKGMIKYIEVSDYIRNEGDVSLGYNNDVNGETLLIQCLQAQVEDALPSFPMDNEDSYSDDLLGNEGQLVKMMLLRTSGTTHFKYAVESNSSGGGFTGSNSFSAELPPIVCWINFSSIPTLFDLLNEVGKSVESFYESNGRSSGAFGQKHASSCGNVKRGCGPAITTLSGKESSIGNILIPNARVVLCFPLKCIKDTEQYCSWEQFIVLDISSPLNMNKEVLKKTTPFPDSTSQNGYSSMGVRCLNLNLGSLGVYIVTSACGDVTGANSSRAQGQKFSAHKIVSACNSPGCLSVVSLLWQEGPVSGPWVADRAKVLATLEEATNKVVGKGNEFATVTTVKNLEDLHSQTRQEIILSSAKFVHVRLSPVVINLESSEYAMFHDLLNEMISGLSCMAGVETVAKGEASVMQTSILLECVSVEVLIRLDIKESIKSSMQRELPGSWNSLKLNIKKFEMLSVSNIGDIKDAGFFWLAHEEGKLCGSVTAVPDEEFVLISCCNSTMKRGDGGGSNALSSRLAGSDIIHLQLPHGLCSYLSISVRCSTIIATGGRLDWLETISSFFSLPSRETEREGDPHLEEKSNSSSESSFVLNLVDVGLGYEPYLKNLVVQNTVLGCESSPTNVHGEVNEPYVTCLLAASSLNLSNRTLPDSVDNDYNIRLQDLGLLLSQVSGTEPRQLGGTYSVDHLRKMGCVKIAREALIEIILRTNCRNGLSWEVECSKSLICVETCHDTTAALIRLAGQLQQLVAPDVEESLVHLQTRWNNFQQAQAKNEMSAESGKLASDHSQSTPQGHPVSIDSNSESGRTGLMNEICDDAFSLDGNQTYQTTFSESPVRVILDESFLGGAFENSDNSQTSFQPEGCIPEIIEDYCLSELRPLSELSVGSQSAHDFRRCRSWNAGDGALVRGRGGWYEDASLTIVENHVSEGTQQVGMKGYCDWSSPPDKRFDDCKEVMGRVLLKNMNIRWRLIAGSDWYQTRTNIERSTNKYGRDTSVCLELVLSGMQFQCDIFPAGKICVSKLSLFIQDFYLYDRSSAAPWKLVLGYYNSKTRPRESTSKALKLELESVRPDPQTPLEEYRLRVALLPILLHLHQTQLDFLITFFGSNSTLNNQSSDNPENSDGSKLLGTECNKLSDHDIAAEALLPYFQKFEIWPILIRVDYSPRHVDLAALRGGKYVELVNLVPWKGIELELKDVHGVGVYGWSNVCETIMGEWLEDISQNQIHKVLRGLPTIRSLVAVSAGAAKLVSMPVENYRSDHRVLRGMQRGTFAFLRSISLEAIGLGVHLAAGAHDILLQAEYTLTSSPYSAAQPVQSKAKTKTKTNVRCNQPKDAKQGIQQAYESLSGGLGKSASALVRTPLKKYQRGASAGSALATAVCNVPAAAIAPASACASAVHYTLLGIRNSLDPEHKKESMEKYLGPTHSQD